MVRNCIAASATRHRGAWATAAITRNTDSFSTRCNCPLVNRPSTVSTNSVPNPHLPSLLRPRMASSNDPSPHPRPIIHSSHPHHTSTPSATLLPNSRNLPTAIAASALQFSSLASTIEVQLSAPTPHARIQRIGPRTKPGVAPITLER